MKCQTFRERWVQRDMAATTEDAELLSHRAQCTACRETATRLDAVRQEMRSVQADIQPDAGFSARVVQRIETPPDHVEILGWAAWRILPAAMGLLVALLAWGSSVGWTPDRPEMRLLGEDPAQVAVELLLTPEEDR